MDLIEIFNLINKRLFLDAKHKLLSLKKNNKSYEDINFTIAKVCIQLGEFNEAEQNFLSHLKKKPNDYVALFELGTLYFKTYNFKKIENIYLNVLKLNKKFIPAIINLSYFYTGIGNLLEAKKYLMKAIEIDYNNINYHYSMLRLDSNYVDVSKVEFFKKYLDNKKIKKETNYLAYFILSKYYEKKKDNTKELEYLEIAHDNFLKYKKKNIYYDYWLKHLPKKLQKIKYKKSNNRHCFDKLNPIFIIGLPRSGSTITELILSSSKTKTFSLGESSMISSNVFKIYGELISKSSDQINFELEAIENKIQLFFDNISEPNINNKIIIDKSLENFFYVDLILNIFPNAKFVVNERNILDNIIGIYKKMLLEIPWAHSLNDITKYIDNYFKIMILNKKKHKDKFFFVSLEDLLSRDKKTISNLFNFCGLEAPTNQFNFKGKYTMINNASNIQIRDKLRSYNKKKYDSYIRILQDYKKKYNWISFE
jgi:tetratricopeptide (TPR) repeat protein